MDSHLITPIDNREWGTVYPQPDKIVRDEYYMKHLQILTEQKSLPPEFEKTVDKYFWELI